MDLPYRSEYAKSGRSSCRGCKSPIGQGSLRLAVMVQSPMFDGKTPQWYHFMCFFSKQRPKTVDDIDHFEDLRLEDQKKIQEKIAVPSVIVPDAKGKKGKKRDASALAAKKSALQDFKIEYAKSGRAACRGCEQKILKDEVRISKKDFETEVGRKYGGQDMWHHLGCFAKLRSELGYFESADQLPGFKTLKKEDQADAKTQLPAIKQEDVPEVKKIKTEEGATGSSSAGGLDEKQQKLYEEQNKILYKYRDQLQKGLKKDELAELLTENGQSVPVGVDRILSTVADMLTFGALLPCEVCKEGQLYFNKFGYRCLGDLTEWTKCNTMVKEPKRRACVIPQEFKEAYGFLKKYKYVPRTRVVKAEQPDASLVKKEVKEEDETDSKPKVERALPKLYDMEFVIVGKPKRGKDVLKAQLTKLGAKVTTKITGTVMAVIASESDVEKKGARIQEAESANVQVVPEEFADEAATTADSIPDVIVRMSICDWGADSKRSIKIDGYPVALLDKLMAIHKGEIVDPDSGLADIAHPYIGTLTSYGSFVASAVLVKPNVRGEKMICKVQLLKSNDCVNYCVNYRLYEAWGKIGGKGRGRKDAWEYCGNQELDASWHFLRLFRKRTSNDYARYIEGNFEQFEGAYIPIDFDHGQGKAIQDARKPKTRLPAAPSVGLKSKSKSKSIYTSSMPSKMKLKLKNGGAVDPDSGLEDVAHVYSKDKEKYSVVLVRADIQSQKNSFYKLQLLQADKGDRYWVFRSWGRIGTTIGDKRVQNMSSLHEARSVFIKNYEEKTQNLWADRHSFVKHPGMYYPMDIDYGEEETAQKMDIEDAPSSLPMPVQQLIRLIFDVNMMKKLMLEFELDTEKMPLGKLSKKQIQSAYAVLSELQRLQEEKAPEVRFIDASNRFFTLIPHSFGIDNPPVLRDAEAIKQKLDMLDNLMELEIAYNLMKSSGSEHTVDSYYSQLKTEIDVVAADHEEHTLIREYVENTHAATHANYKLKIHDVFTVKRQGEEKRFKPFRKLHNHKLLWHGSRTTNFAGILAQGLRIAPPEAPVTGYMFGKGIYFADMVSKSANYCCTSPANSTGLLLLCDVALGNEYERHRAEYVEKLPKGKHSTKGIGRTHPDPTSSKKLEHIEVPCGKGIPNPQVESHLLYNEYIVYDVAQVQVRYLLKVEFEYKY